VTTVVHPTAIIDPSARLGHAVEIGPWVMVGPQVTVGDRCRLGPRARLVRNVLLAEDVSVGDGSILGGDPQDLKYRGEETWVEVGAGTIIREYSTINRATSQSYRTVVGARCFIMTYVHLAHDCHIGDDVTIANGTQCAGHVTIHDRAVLSGLNAVHQFVTIGTYAFVGGGSRVNQDIPPYVKAVGNPMELYGLNSIGLQRAGFSGDFEPPTRSGESSGRPLRYGQRSWRSRPSWGGWETPPGGVSPCRGWPTTTCSTPTGVERCRTSRSSTWVRPTSTASRGTTPGC
jgi:UDP-N-acetylglucosamine acyltransferase